MSLEDRAKKFLKNFPKPKNKKEYKKLLKILSEQKNKKEYEELLKFLKTDKGKASAFVGAGATVGLIEGGAVGLAVAGTAFGIPAVVAGAVVGVAGYGAYKAGESFFKDKKENPEKKENNKFKILNNENDNES